MTSLAILDAIPDGFLDCNARELHRLLPGPTLIELPGEQAAPLFVSILLHGNEDTGLGAIQRVLQSYRGRLLPRPLMLLVGNVAAAKEGLRRLDGQPDFNRIWPGAEAGGESAEAQIMAEVHKRVLDRGAFAAIDIHNNTGRNPHYGVICTREDSVIGLAELFATRAVLFRGLPGTQTASFSGLIPAVTAECGQPGRTENAEAAARFVASVLALEALPRSEPDDRALNLFHTLGVVRLKSEVAFGNAEGVARLDLDPGIEGLNFQLVEAGTALGTTDHPNPLEVIDEDGHNVATEYFEVRDGMLRLIVPAIPAMLTLDERIIRQDCLGYLMEHLPPV